MFKRALFLGIVSGLLAGIAGIIYARVYYTANEADFSKVVTSVKIVSASLFGGILAAIGYTLLVKGLKTRGEIVFNLLFTIISFASLLAPIAYKLPLTIETPELFPGMVIPMHFFPALGWYTLKPLFIKESIKEPKAA
jgi:ABC-type branched-subunit amino acid transport system permease subunit